MLLVVLDWEFISWFMCSGLWDSLVLYVDMELQHFVS